MIQCFKMQHSKSMFEDLDEEQVLYVMSRHYHLPCASMPPYVFLSFYETDLKKHT